jgi:radical SAM protein
MMSAPSPHGPADRPKGIRHGAGDFASRPMNVYWEITQACALACRHCRAEAIPLPHPNQLTFQEGLGFLDQILEFGDPLPQLILTGGDPLEHPDLFALIDGARDRGIPVSITPAATEALTRETLERLKAHGVDGLGLSLDGSKEIRHDSIRGVDGTFRRTMRALAWASELEIPIQVNTLVAQATADDLPAVFQLLSGERISRWSLFFLISVGRGKVLEPLSVEEAERVMRWIYECSATAPFVIATTEAPSYRRVALERMREEGLDGQQVRRHPALRGAGVRDGHGVVFVSSTGEVCPAGFLPIAAGNVRKQRLAELYRDAPLFRQLHEPQSFEGRCGYCEYQMLCGGSRARAFSATQTPLGSDPLCDYLPARATRK